MISMRSILVSVAAGGALLLGSVLFAARYKSHLAPAVPAFVITEEQQLMGPWPAADQSEGQRRIMKDIRRYDPAYLTGSDAAFWLKNSVMCDDTVSAQSLLDGGVLVEVLTARTSDSKSALEESSNALSPRMFQILSQHGAFAHLRNSEKAAFLDGAIYNGNVPEVKFLVAHGAQLSQSAYPALVQNEMTDPDKWYMDKAQTQSDITLAECITGANGRRVGKNRAELTRVLLAAGADPNQTSFEGIIALPFAIVAGDTGSVRQLIAHGAKLDLTNPKVRLAVTYARKYRFTDILAIIHA